MRKANQLPVNAQGGHGRSEHQKKKKRERKLDKKILLVL